VPWLGFFWVAKPTIGPALFLAYPSWRAALGCAVVLVASLILLPHWPAAMRANVYTIPHMIPLIMRPGGVLLLLGLLRWRRPEGRLLGALALFPQTPMLYETLPLYLIPQSFREYGILTALSLVVPHLVTRPATTPFATRMVLDWPWIFLLCYLPALIMVLRRPNTADPSDPLAGLTLQRLWIRRIRASSAAAALESEKVVQ
jgi:hypothetical protein